MINHNNNTRNIKKSLQSLVLLLMALMVPMTATAAYDQLAEGVYLDGTTLYITSGVTSLGPIQVNPSVIYSFAAVPPLCTANTFTGYGATLHMPATSYGAYFVTDYWCNFANMNNDAVEPTNVTISSPSEVIELGRQLNLFATVTPSNATPSSVAWSTSDAAVATVYNGVVTARGVGECDITATCIDKHAVCHISVIETTIVITLDKHVAKLLPNHSLTITPTMAPISTDLKVTSSDSNVAAARLMNGVVQVVGLAEGTTMIVVSSVDDQAVPDTCTVKVYTEVGDVNCDGFVSISDVTNMIDFLLSDNQEGISINNTDTNRDGNISISDVTCLIDYLLSGFWPWEFETITVNGVSFKMMAVEGGTFMMGATAEQGSDAGDSEKPAHQVTLSSYSIGETEVTQALWQAVMGSNPSYFSPTNGYFQNLQRPVELVSWNDCQAFISKLNQMTGKNFRLPTEAEWEFAARGGKLSQGYKYAGSNNIDSVAWYVKNSYSGSSSSPNYCTHTIATKAPNELGLYDMTGNVSEWCQDWYGSYSSDAQTNPTGPASGDYRVGRGMDWGSTEQSCRVSMRGYVSPSLMGSNIGLRLALDLDKCPKFSLSETVVTVLVGERKTVEILNGDGIYTVVGGNDNVTSTINGSSLAVTGTYEGTTTVHVTNTNTGATAVLTVIVITSTVEDGHEYVDLGLPSGTLWATCNVGADSPEEYGDYFAWGETEPKYDYDWSTYKWCNGSENTLTKYCTDSSFGTVDNKTELEPEDDAAYVNWGLSWRIPTVEQIQELYDNCTSQWTTRNGVNGRLVTGPNGKTLFLPAAGVRRNDSLDYAGSYGYYWSHMVGSYDPYNAYYLNFFSGDWAIWCFEGRCGGFTVRAVRASQN